MHRPLSYPWLYVVNTRSGHEPPTFYSVFHNTYMCTHYAPYITSLPDVCQSTALCYRSCIQHQLMFYKHHLQLPLMSALCPQQNVVGSGWCFTGLAGQCACTLHLTWRLKLISSVPPPTHYITPAHADDSWLVASLYLLRNAVQKFLNSDHICRYTWLAAISPGPCASPSARLTSLEPDVSSQCQTGH